MRAIRILRNINEEKLMGATKLPRNKEYLIKFDESK